MTRFPLATLRTALASGVLTAALARAGEPSAPPASGRCATMTSQALRELRQALRPHVSNNDNRVAQILGLDSYVGVNADRFCVEGRNGTWAIRFDVRRAWFAKSALPHRESLFVPWRLVHIDAAGTVGGAAGFNPFFNRVRNMPVPAREGAATFGFFKVVPQLIVGDFDGSGRDQVIVMSKWARWKGDSGRAPGPEGLEFDLWSTERALGRAYVFTGGAVRRAAGTEGLWITSADRCPQTSEWVIGTYGRFFRFEEASPLDDADVAHPVHGPIFRLFRAATGGLTLDTPRQNANLRRACEEAVRLCAVLYPVENAAVFDSVCERVPGAPSVRANADCASSIDAVRRGRSADWLERWRRTPVPGVGPSSGAVISGDDCECSVSDAALKPARGSSAARCTAAALCGRYVVEDPGSGVGESATGLVHDTETNLRWLRFGSPYMRGHADALAYCQRKGMRLPTREEALKIGSGRFCREAWPLGWQTWTGCGDSSGRVWAVRYDGREWEKSVVDDGSGVPVLCVE